MERTADDWVRRQALVESTERLIDLVEHDEKLSVDLNSQEPNDYVVLLEALEKGIDQQLTTLGKSIPKSERTFLNSGDVVRISFAGEDGNHEVTLVKVTENLVHVIMAGEVTIIPWRCIDYLKKKI